jgi:4-alpha-glucanotransferase
LPLKSKPPSRGRIASPTFGNTEPVTSAPEPIATDLARLADAYGVATEYTDQLRRTIEVKPASVIAVLGALGVDASSPAAIAQALQDVADRPSRPPVVVQRQGEDLSLPAGQIVLEDGTEAADAAGLPLGWHRIVTADGAEIPYVVAPARVPLPAGRHWGTSVQLYATRSERSWGIGDIADLATLVDWTAHEGGGLVLVNPLHASAPVAPMQNSPYYPASRRWTNPIYLRIEQTSAYAAAPADVRRAIDELRVDNDGDRIDRDRVWAAKLRALELLFAAAAPLAVDELEPGLRDWATWCALTEVHGPDWREWPDPLRRPHSAAVDAARRELMPRVALHAWLQQLCDEQLRDVQDRARAAGMPIGVVHDLAVGTDPAGADAWALQDALALGARIGAPPDSFNQQGQDWGMPPWHPHRLAALGYAPLREMLRSLLSHAGGVRIDHVLGLFRMWWVPADGTAKDGTYVSYDADALLGVVALEAHRADAVVIGEDLGTVTPVVRRELASRQVLGTSVLWFERESPKDGKAGRLRPLDKWREEAAASVTTHDLPTALGWLRGEHVHVRAELGLLDDPKAEDASWHRERDELLALLREAGLVGAEATEDELVVALHAAVASTPSRIVLVSPGDAIGDIRQPNLPGTTEEYPSWRLPVADREGRPVLLPELLADERVRRVAAVLRERVR